MIFYERKIESSRNETKLDDSVYSSTKCMASINSKGCLTIRKYDTEKCGSEDEIIVFSETETQAVISLFEKLKDFDKLPF